MNGGSLIVHATSVVFKDKGVLIVGPSGSGKSALALSMIALGSMLVADDRTKLASREGALFASSPVTIKGLIEARGVGIITLPQVQGARIQLVIDMSRIEASRFPEKQTYTVLDIALPCLHKVDAPYFPAAVIAYLLGTLHETL
jgi:HPr kinase/phosphorylase